MACSIQVLCETEVCNFDMMCLNATSSRVLQITVHQCCKLHIMYRLFTGPGIAPQSIPADSSNVVLILNGREASKVSIACRWLDYVVEHSSQFINIAVVLLGNERCNNSWVMKYMVTRGGPVKVAFIVYDSPDVDNDVFYQWPLGVAT